MLIQPKDFKILLAWILDYYLIIKELGQARGINSFWHEIIGCSLANMFHVFRSPTAAISIGSTPSIFSNCVDGAVELILPTAILIYSPHK